MNLCIIYCNSIKGDKAEILFKNVWPLDSETKISGSPVLNQHEFLFSSTFQLDSTGNTVDHEMIVFNKKRQPISKLVGIKMFIKKAFSV